MLRFAALCVILFNGCNAFLSGRIVNGTNARTAEIPYIVSFRMNYKHFCGGSILDACHILTAAHCVYNKMERISEMSIQYGVTQISQNKINSIKVIQIVVHPDYCASLYNPNDIAVLTLERAIPFSNRVKPVRLPRQGDPTPALQEAVLAGWGRLYTNGPKPKNLQLVKIMVFADKACKRIYAHTDNYHHLCAGNPDQRKGQCSADSGSPLYVQGVQVGIVSFSKKPCASMGGVFAKVSSYVDWIKNQMKYRF